MALATQNKDTVQVPNGLALSECRGYEDWAAVAVSHPDSTLGASEEPDDNLNLIVANPVMIEAYRAGVPQQRAYPHGPLPIDFYNLLKGERSGWMSS
jgi:hypothetical protein